MPDPATGFKWELYDISKDWTENNNLAASNPQKLKELQDVFWVEARKYQVLPLDASALTRFVAPRPNITAGRTEFNYATRVTGIPLGDAPNLLNTSYTITADIEVPAGGAEGMLMTQGGRFGGWGFYLAKGKPVFTWNLLDLKRVRWEGPEVLAPGKHTLVFDFKYDGLGPETLAFNSLSGIARGGIGVFKVDGKDVSSQKLERTIPFLLQWDETFDIGSDTGTGVDDRDYQVPFAFTGNIVQLNIKIDRPKLSAADIKLLETESQRNNRKSE
jgi:arylsulfatase